MRVFRHLAPVAVALGLVASGAALPHTYPDHPIRLVVPYAAGGGPDVQARQLAQVLARHIGQPIVVENKVGAGGILAAEYVMQQPPDGYTLLLGSSTHVTQKLLQPSVRFDPAKFTHITRLSAAPSVLLVNAASPYLRLGDLVNAARRAPGTLNFASGGIGSAAHLAGAAFSSASGIDTLHVPYRGSVEIVPSLIKGDTQFGFPIASTAMPQIRAGKVRALAVTSVRRNPALPDVPTLNEAMGRTDMALDAWSGIWGPPGMPAAIVSGLNTAITTSLADPNLRQAYARDGVLIHPTASPDEFNAFVREQTTRYRAVIERNHITLQ